MERSLIQLKTDLEEIATKHKQINSFFWGDFIDAINRDVVDYPLMVCTLQPSTLGDQYVGVDMQIIVADKYDRQDYDVINEVHSDTLRIVKDIDTTFKQYRFTEYMDIETDLQNEPFVNRGQDMTAGYALNVRLRIHDYEDACAIPYDNLDFENGTTGTGCPGGTVSITDDDGNVLYSVSVASNGSETQSISDSTIQLNGVNRFSVNAEDTQNINLLDQNGDNIPVDSVSGDDVTLKAIKRNPDAYIIKVRTYESGTSNDNQYTIDVNTGSYVYDYNVVTSDGQSFTNQTGDLTITFPYEGVFEIAIIANSADGFNQHLASTDADKLIDIIQFGANEIGAAQNGSYNACSNLNISSSKVLNISKPGTDMRFFFRDNDSLASNPVIADFNWSNVDNMNGVFRGDGNFNVDLNSIDVSNVIDFQLLFSQCVKYNHYLGDWQLNNSLTTMFAIFASSGMSTENYTDTIVGWANYVFNNGDSPSGVDMSTQAGMTFDTARSGGANFADAGTARTYLTTTASWTISGDTVI